MINIESNGIHFSPDPKVKQKRFWMVFGDGCGRPTFQHSTKESAHKEAQRLSLANPGKIYTVLKSTQGYLADIPVIKQVKVHKEKFSYPGEREMPF